MKSRPFASLAVLLGMFGAAMPGSTHAAEVVLKCSTAMRSVMQELIPKFEQASGHKVLVEYGVANLMQKELAAGKPFDVALLIGQPLDLLVKDGIVAPGSRTPLARLGIAVGIHAGGKAYDVSSAEAFKRTLGEAQSIVYAAAGSSGIYFVSLLKRLGLHDSLQSKLVAAQTGDEVGIILSAGKAELGILPASELLPLRDVRVVGPFPEDYQEYSYMVGGISSKAAQPGAAAELLAFIHAPANRTVFTSKALDPVQ